nr:MAG: hypothetical protein [Bacteriophage sp.]
MTNNLELLKFNLEEERFPYFTDKELTMSLELYKTVENATYYMALKKSQNTGFSASGLSVNDTSDYFKRIAARFRPNNSGVINVD